MEALLDDAFEVLEQAGRTKSVGEEPALDVGEGGDDHVDVALAEAPLRLSEVVGEEARNVHVPRLHGRQDAGAGFELAAELGDVLGDFGVVDDPGAGGVELQEPPVNFAVRERFVQF